MAKDAREQRELKDYYEFELTYLRKLGAEFAQRYPKIASRLQLETSKTEDPHVERLLEGFAFLAARVHRRLDDDFPEISEALLEMLHPQFVRPVPSMCIVDMPLDPAQGRLPDGHHVPRGSVLQTQPVNRVRCTFRTVYDTTLWPLTISHAEWTTPDRAGVGTSARDAVGAIRLEIRAFEGVKLADLAIDALRLHLAGGTGVVDTLYELLLNNTMQVVVRNPDRPHQPPIVIKSGAVKAVGFGENESMLPYPNRTFGGHSLLIELFAFPQKFHFVDLEGFGNAIRTLGATDRVDVSFLISSFERADRRQQLELELSARSFRTNATPAVNLFQQSAEPILLSERRFEHLVVAEVRQRLEIEVWSVDQVKLVEHEAREAREIAPLYSHRHNVSGTGNDVFWHVTRRPAPWRTDGGTELHLAFSDMSGTVRAPDVDVASLRVTCFNGDLPSLLPFGADNRGDFELIGAGPIHRIYCVVNPTKSVQPALGSSMLWRMISSLSLNHLSIVDGTPDARQELLRLHNMSNDLGAERQIDGLVKVSSEPSFARVDSPHGIAFARGRRIELEFDEQQFPGGGMFLMATVLERFFALYASMNSFTQVAVRSRQRRRPVTEWPARAGGRTLI